MAWSEDFQRLVLAAAIRGELLYTIPLAPELFGSANERGPLTPRQRIADAVASYFAKYGTRPAPEALGQMISEAASRLGPEETEELSAEAEAVLATSPPEDPRFVLDKVRSASELRALERGLVQAADLLSGGGELALEAARELVAKAAAPIELAGVRDIEYIASAEARVAMWQSGEEYGERISTGFDGLDEAMRGGPTRRESHYFLAPPKGAKTAALLTVATSALRRRLGVYLVTFEMQAIRMALRVDRKLSASTKEELEGDAARLKKAIEGLRATGAAELYIDERPPQRPNSVGDVARRIQEIRRKGGRVDVAVLDYLNIMGASKDEQEKRHELPRISRDISAMAKQLDVLTWSAALVNRKAVGKKVVRKTDIAEAFEVVAVADGMVAICATSAMVRAGLRRFYLAAQREEQDEVRAGDYVVDFARQSFSNAGADAVDSLPDMLGEE